MFPCMNLSKNNTTEKKNKKKTSSRVTRSTSDPQVQVGK